MNVVALGGNALVRPGERGTAAEQRARVRETVAALGPLLDEPLVVTHGNGPQVGNELLRHERAAEEVPPLPLWLAVGQTQGEIGALVVSELAAAAGRPAACVITHVFVDADDPAFSSPTKPIGPFYGRERAEQLARERGWELVDDAERGWRRAVPSPAPLEIAELAAIRVLVSAGTDVVACGGGGIPVVHRAGRRDGVDAVIDKDRASAVLGTALGAKRLVILTEVDALMRRFGTPAQSPVARLSAGEATRLARELPAGSMGPKVEAGAAFARDAGGETLITSAAALADALAGRAGTTIVP